MQGVAAVVDPTWLLVVAAGGLAGCGGALLVLGAPRRRSGPGLSWRSVGAGGRRLLLAAGVGLLVLLLTRWIVAGVAAGLMGLVWDRFFGGAKAEQHSIDRLEGLAGWTESLRDTIAGAVGLEQAIPAAARAAAPAVAAPLGMLADRLAVRIPLTTALLRLAEELDDAAADLVVAALILNSRLRGPGLRDVLSGLAVAIREELEVRRRILASRRSTRRSVQIVVGVTVFFVVGLARFNPDYVAPYGSVQGQLFLCVVVGLFAVGFWWLRSLSAYETPRRVLAAGAAPAAVGTDR